MRKPVLFLLLLLAAPTLPAAWATDAYPITTTSADDEYDRYKKKGDDLYREGRYLEARRQYQNCLLVPNFENDPYAKEQIENCTRGLALRQQADDALQQGKGADAVDLYKQLLTVNASDAVTKAQLADYHERQGNTLFNQKRYAEARSQYQQALSYTTTRQGTIQLQLDNINRLTKPPKYVGLKVATGAVAVGAAAYAAFLHSDFQNKRNTVVQLGQTADPTNSGSIGPDDLNRPYQEAYDAAERAKSKNGLFKACVGVAAVATLAEVYLLVRKPKAKPTAWQVHPASESWGLTLRRGF
jgi:tetratricopeptide (TPR) repeat protein